jgi:hypothetical protein
MSTVMKKRTIHFLMYDQDIIHGGFFDNFDYYYRVREVFKDCDVRWKCITSFKRSDVLAVLKEKYDVDPEVFKGIDVIKHGINQFHRNPLKVDVLICATNSAMFWFLQNGNIQASKSYIGLSDWKDIHPKQNKYYPNHYILGDERIYNYNDCNFRPYRKKILFDKYIKRESSEPKYDYMTNLSLVERRFPKEWIMGMLNKFGYPDKKFAGYVGSKNTEYYSWLNDIGVDVVIPPFDDFMGMFKTFIYLPYKDGTDATPRLIPECVFFDKGLEFYDEGISMKSGGYYRFRDVLYDFNGLWLKEDDDIMGYIEKCLNL